MRIRRSTERWFKCDGDPDEGSILIKDLTPGEIQDIVDKAMPRKYEYEADEKGNQIPKLTVNMDNTLQRELTFKACILDWKNFFDAEGKPLECTPENIVRASREIEGFNEFVIDCQNTLTKDIAEEKQGQEKNLSSSV